jgi:hypothetical protein
VSRAARHAEIRVTTHLGTPAAEVWSVVSTMEGVNDELRPWISMTHPPGFGALDSRPVPPGEVLFKSWLLAGRFLPIDRHHLALACVLPGVGFDEESSSWLQRRWRHERRVEPHPSGGCTVSDVVLVEPRIGAARPLVGRVVRSLFRHRHRRLVRRFGRIDEDR